MTNSKTDIRSTPFELEVRKQTRFDFSNTQAIHSDDNLYISHFFNALSLITPITEGLLIRSIRKAQPLLKDSILEADAKAFIGQEAIHTREHRELNRRIFQLGYDLEPLLDHMEADMKALEQRISLREALAIVVTGEHAIYSIARSLLKIPHDAYQQDAEVRRLFIWHALEEMEHQSVCDDIYRHLYGEGLNHKLFYCRVFFTAGKLLANMISKVMRALLATDRKAQPGEFKSFLNWLLVSPGLGSQTTKELLTFFLPNFEHWARSEEDQQLIKNNLKWVYAS